MYPNQNLKYKYNLFQDRNFQPIPIGSGTYPKEIFKGFMADESLHQDVFKYPCAYLMHHLKTDKIYVGSSGIFKERKYRHMYRLKSGKHTNANLTECYNEDTWFAFYIQPFNTREEAQAKEDELIKQYLNSGFLLNISPDAYNQTGFKHSEETKRKMSELRQTDEMRELSRKNAVGYKFTDEQRANLSAAMKGHVISEKNRQITSALFKGVPRNEEAKAAMKAAALKRFPKCSLDGVVYDNVTAASKILGIGKSTIDYRIVCDNPLYKNWIKLPSETTDN